MTEGLTAVGIQTSLDSVENATRLIDAMRLSDDLAFEASREGGLRTIRVLTRVLGGDDQLSAIAATHALAQIYDEEAQALLSQLLSSEHAHIREHAAWAIGFRVPRFEAVGRLIGQVIEGGFVGMIAQRTIEQWSAPAPDLLAVALEGALQGVHEPAARARIVETLGLVRAGIARRPLLGIATDTGEDARVRTAAIAALGQRPGDLDIVATLESIAASDSELSPVARLSLLDIAPAPRVARTPNGLRVAQLFLNADIDAGLQDAGRGDNGGIATLLVRLGDALVARSAPDDERIDAVLTMSRGSIEAALESVETIATQDAGHAFGRIPLLSEPVQSASAWPLRVTARRGIRRLLKAAGGVDVLHLRMADVGSLAAADAARELNIPVVFTVAPDPHAVINSLDLAGQLTRQNFGETDVNEHFWFRTRLVRRLESNASHTVLFPRPELRRDLFELVGIDITAHPERHTIVPEGIDLGVVDSAVTEASDRAAGSAPSAPIAELEALLEGLPAHRRGLPLIVSVGRLHRVKGMASIVSAWADTDLRDRANLLIVGGDILKPSPDESEQLGRIDAIIPAADRLASGLLLPGHQPNDTVARWVAAARFGLPGLVAPRGIYVCGSLKEEFGIALLEAMATGLLVVAPDGGGPATYVKPGDTGYLTSTWDVATLGESIRDALATAASETTDDRAHRSRATVEQSFTIQAMAESLSSVYGLVHAHEEELSGGARTLAGVIR